MPTKRSYLQIIIVIFVLIAFIPACDLFKGSENQVDTPASITETAPNEEPNQVEKSTQVVMESPTAVPDSPAETEVQLGDEYRSAAGGFAFQPVSNYKLQEYMGFATLMAPLAKPDSGPGFLMIGEVTETETTLEDFYQSRIGEMTTENVTLSEPRAVNLGNVRGLEVELNDTSDEGVEVIGYLTFVLISPTHQFILLGMAPEDAWEAFVPLYDAVASTITFFEPEVSTQMQDEDEPESDLLHQWATSAVASSEYGNPDFSASQALGIPDTFTNECADMPTAWAAYEGDTVEWIELTYDSPVIPTEINIFQTHSPDQVVLVELIDTSGTYHQVYSGEPENLWDECPYLLSIPVDVNYQAVAIKITIDQSVIPTTWNEIDAVELVGYPAESAVTQEKDDTPPQDELSETLFLQDPPLPSAQTGEVNLRLMELGYSVCEPSGFYNIQTESAVKQFQSANGLVVDGVVDGDTWERLFSEKAVFSPQPAMQITLEDPIQGIYAGAFASDGSRIWALSPGFNTLEAYDPDSPDGLVGIFGLSTLRGEENYDAQVIAFDGERLWVAFQGSDDAILQAYDPETSPIEGILTPLLPESIRIPDVIYIRGISYAVGEIWLAYESFAFPSGILSIDSETGTLGQVIQFGMESYANAPAFGLDQLWVPVEGYYGGRAIRQADPSTGELGDTIGVCGTQIVFDGAAFWVANENQLSIVSLSGEVHATAQLEGTIRAITFYGARLWVLFDEGNIQYYQVW